MRSCRYIVVLCLAVAPATAEGERVLLEGELPFTAEELAAAIALRTDEARGVVHVIASRSGVVAVRVGGAERSVDVSGLDGAEAARRVALACLDLIDLPAEEAPPLPAADPGEAGSPAEVPDRAASAALDREPAAARRPGADRAARIGGDPAATIGGAAAGPAPRPGLAVGVFGRSGAGAGLDLRVPIGRVALHGQGSWVSRPAAAGDAIDEVALRMGAAAARRWGRIEVGAAAGLIASAHRIRADDAGLERVRVNLRAGAGASARIRIDAAKNLGLVALAGLDGFATRRRYLVGEEVRFDAKRFDAWVGAGVEVELRGSP